jgi:hypothetical protein
MQIPILTGIYTDALADVRTSYPVNLQPVPKQTGLSSDFLRLADGVVQAGGDIPGIDRGGIEWNGIHYRVAGNSLIRVNANASTTTIGTVAGTEQVIFDYSFNELAVCAGGNMYFWNGATFTQANYTTVTIGAVIDFCFVDGRYMLTDGERLFLTDIGNPLNINPFAFEEPVADPDPVTSLLRLRNEVYAVNRHTIEVYDNTGTALPFPFSVIAGAQIQKGAVGVQACCVFTEAIAFLGSGRGEAPAVYIGENANAQKISTQDIDDIILSYPESQLSLVKLETRNDRSHQLLYVHLPDRTLVFDGAASQVLQSPVWYVLTSGLSGYSQYLARNFVWVNDKWWAGHPQLPKIGNLTKSVGSHWGQLARWEFGTLVMYNEGKGAIVHELELVALSSGQLPPGQPPTISTSYSINGQAWSQPKYISIGTVGNRTKRLVWFKQGAMRNWRVQKFAGDSRANMAFLRLEAQVEPLVY